MSVPSLRDQSTRVSVTITDHWGHPLEADPVTNAHRKLQLDWLELDITKADGLLQLIAISKCHTHMLTTIAS